MAAPIATREPTEIQAGNTLQFTKSLGDYPATTWTLSYSLRKRDGQAGIDFTATADGSDFAVTVTAATTAAWASGDYILVGYVTSGTDRYEVYRGRLNVTQDIAEASAFDPRGFFERTRDKLRTMIEGSDAEGIGGIVRDILRYGYNGTNTEVVSMKDAFDALAWLDNRVRQEQNKGRQQRVLTRFRCPT
jgi:hypothetical protein